jgi:hypothetical protein
LIVVNDKQLPLAAFEAHAVGMPLSRMKANNSSRDPAEPATGNAKSLQRAVVKTADNRLLADLTNLGRLACGVDRLRTHMKPSSSW